MQGTAAVVLAAAFSAVKAAGSRIRDQRVVIYGAGTAGLGIADMMRDQMIREGLSFEEATARFYPLTRGGLLLDDMELLDFQVPYARPRVDVADWVDADGTVGLASVVAHAHPTMMIGTSTQTGAFTEAIVRDMAAHTERPIIMPLSNPTSKCEALPADLIAWTGRPGAHRDRQPVRPGGARRAQLRHRAGQQRPGVPRARARRHGGQGQPDQRPDDRRRRRRGGRHERATALGAPLLPAMDSLRQASAAVAIAVAREAAAEGLARHALRRCDPAGAPGDVAAGVPERRGRLSPHSGQPAPSVPDPSGTGGASVSGIAVVAAGHRQDNASPTGIHSDERRAHAQRAQPLFQLPGLRARGARSSTARCSAAS